MTAWQQQLLENLQQRGVLSGVERQQLTARPATPWYMVLLTALAAWLAAVLVVSATLFLFSRAEPGMLALCGVLTLSVALWLLRRSGEFAAQLVLACSLIGQALLVFAVLAMSDWSGDSWRMAAWVGGGLATLLLLPRAHYAHQLLCALLMMGNGALLAATGPWLGLYGITLAALAVVLWLHRGHWVNTRVPGTLRALASAATMVALMLGWVIHAQMLDMLDSHSQVKQLSWLYPAGAGALLLCTGLWLVRHMRALVRAGYLVAMLVTIALCAQMPGLLVGAALWLAVFHACDRHWSIVVGIGTSGYLGALYYSLHITLLNKSLLLLATGLALLLLRWLLLRLWTKV